MGGQVGEEVELAPGEGKFAAGEVGGARGGVDAQVGDLEDGRARGPRAGGRGTAQYGGEPGRELAAGERLHQVVVGPGVEQPDDLGLLVPGGGDQHRDAGYAADHPQHVEPVEVGQPEVEHDDVGRALGDVAQRLETLVCGLHRVAVSGEDLDQRGPDHRVVLDDKYGGHGQAR